jgi:hypothetical protein
MDQAFVLVGPELEEVKQPPGPVITNAPHMVFLLVRDHLVQVGIDSQ